MGDDAVTEELAHANRSLGAPLDTDRRFAAAYTQNFTSLVRLAVLLVGSTAAAEDIVQDAFARLHLRWALVEEPGAWLRVAVLNACRNERRRLGVARRHSARLVTRPSPDPTAERCAASDVLAALQRLPHRQRAVVVLRFYLGLPEAEIAQTLNMRPGTVKSSLHRALARLERELGTEED